MIISDNSNTFGSKADRSQLICKKSCYSTGRVKFFIETFRALGVARGHSVTN